MMNLKKYFWVANFLCAAMAQATELPDYLQNAPCEEFSNFKVFTKQDGQRIVEVLANQIYIQARLATHEDQTLVYLIQPDDLGPGGVRLHWDDFLTTHPVMTLQKLNQSRDAVTWYGFWSLSRSGYMHQALNGLDGAYVSKETGRHDLYQCDF
ncbi:hypothetical protein KCN56_08935 [Photobacterium galatheae]|uniref:hypothetical protein n=1 Tax=Photobacterium galatheae TaxID=1654360 RepID=UPI00202CD01C|nr:hypothetical protein [Photobacterium galatheae]MCM0148682.1 hypothetical protein [Photobacterium galatheae]